MTAASTDHASAAHDLLAIERRLWTNDADYYEATLASESVFVFAETGVLTGEQAVSAIRDENRTGRRWGEVRISGERVIPVGEDARLLVYRADARWKGEHAWHHALCSSLYLRRDGAWKLVFHQQSALPTIG